MKEGVNAVKRLFSLKSQLHALKSLHAQHEEWIIEWTLAHAVSEPKVFEMAFETVGAELSQIP